MSGGGGARVSITGITSGVKKMIHDIREISGEHSDEDIYAMLKECSMDPNETAQRLLHLDTFHEVKKKHGKRKENVVVKPADIPGKQRGAWVGRGAKVDSVHVRRRSFGGSKENGYPNMSKGHKSENKAAPENSRSVHVKVNGKSIQDVTPQANAGHAINIYTGHNHVSEVVKSDETCMPADGGKLLDLKLTPATFSAKQEIEPVASMSSEIVHIVGIFSGNLACENQYAMSNGDADLPIDKIETSVARDEIVDTTKSQPPVQAKGVAVKETVYSTEKQPMSEEDSSVLHEDSLTVGVSDGHVVFPEHLQVPEAFKTMLTFGSFDDSWPLGGKPTTDRDDVSTDVPMLAEDSHLVDTVGKSSIESGDNVSSTVKDAQESSSYLRSSHTVSTSNHHLFECASSDVVIKIDESETESILHNGGPDIAYHPSSQVFGYAPKPQLQAHDNAEPQGGNLITSPTSDVDQNSNIQPSVVAHDTVTSPPPGPFLRQTYHPSFFPYGHFYPQFFVPQVHQQYLPPGSFPQQSLVPNVYLSPVTAGAIRHPHQQQKQQELNTGSNGNIGVPSGYNPYVPYAFPYGMPGSVAGNDDQFIQLKENDALTTEQQMENPGDWMAGTSRTVSGMQINPFYSLTPGQGHPMVFPPTPTGFGPLGGVYHPLVQTIPATQPTIHPHNQQHYSMGSAEPPVFYQPRPSQGAPILHNNNKQ